ncbi:MAG: hypothetical protein WCO05_03530 [Candidatus Moraniibacteriota bacterium]
MLNKKIIIRGGYNLLVLLLCVIVIPSLGLFGAIFMREGKIEISAFLFLLFVIVGCAYLCWKALSSNIISVDERELVIIRGKNKKVIPLGSIDLIIWASFDELGKMGIKKNDTIKQDVRKYKEAINVDLIFPEGIGPVVTSEYRKNKTPILFVQEKDKKQHLLNMGGLLGQEHS